MLNGWCSRSRMDMNWVLWLEAMVWVQLWLTKYSLLLHTKEKHKSIDRAFEKYLKEDPTVRSLGFCHGNSRSVFCSFMNITTQEQTWGMLSFYSQSNKTISLSHEFHNWKDTEERMATRSVNITKCDQSTNEEICFVMRPDFFQNCFWLRTLYNR